MSDHMSDQMNNRANISANDRMNDQTISTDDEQLVTVRDHDDLTAALEAILIATDRPVESEELAHVLSHVSYVPDESDDSRALIDNALESLKDEYETQGRGFELHHNVQGWQLMSSQEFEQVVARFITDGQTSRLSQAALEALAIIAYKQPITRAQVSAIRGVNSDGVIRSLSVRGLIREQGSDEQTHAALLATTGLFLDKMNIRTVDELPSLAPFLPQTFPMDDTEDTSSENSVDVSATLGQ